MFSLKGSFHRRRSHSATTRGISSHPSFSHNSRKAISLKRSQVFNRSPSRGLNSRTWKRRNQKRTRVLSVCSDRRPTMHGDLRSPETIFASDHSHFSVTQKYRRNPSWRSSTWSSSPRYADVSELSGFEDICKARSTAFWDLQRSVEESGQGLIHRMREHEQQRSNRAFGERGRLRAQTYSPPISSSHLWKQDPIPLDEPDDDDIKIYSGDGQLDCARSNEWPNSAFGPHSLQQPLGAHSRSTSFPTFAPIHPPSYDGPGPAHFNDLEQTLATITLSFANGAGSINDYCSISPRHHVTEHLDAGDLWR